MEASASFLHSMRTRLLFSILGIGLLPLGITAAVSINNMERSTEAQVGASLGANAHQLGEMLDRLYYERFGDVTAWAGSPVARSTPQLVTSWMNELMPSYNMYQGMILTDETGKVIAVNTVDYQGRGIDPSGLIGRSLSSEAWFQSVSTGRTPRGQVFMADVAQVPLSSSFGAGEDLTVAFAAGVYDENGKLVRVWCNLISKDRTLGSLVDDYAENLAESNIPVTVQIINKEGLLLESTDNTGILKTNLVDAGFATARKATAGVGQGFLIDRDPTTDKEEVNGYAQHEGFLTYPGLGWSVLMREDMAHVDAVVNEVTRITWGALAASALAISAIGFFLSRRIAGPVEAAATAVEKMGEGDFSQRVDAVGQDELARLGKALNATIGQIGSAMEARKQATKVQAIVDNSPAPVILVGADMVISYLNPAAQHTLRRVESALRVASHNLVGQSIDALPLPEELRSRLSSASRLPYQTEGIVGSEVLSIHAYPILDASGAFTGPALAFEIVTEEVRLRQRDVTVKAAFGRVQLALQRIAKGDINEHITESFGDELDPMRDNVNRITATLQTFRDELRKLAEAGVKGDLNKRADISTFQGDYRLIGEQVNAMLEAMVVPVSRVREALRLVASGDLTANVQGDFQGDHALLKDALNETVMGLRMMVENIQQVTMQIGAGSAVLTQTSQSLSTGATSQASAVEEISASATEIAAQTRNNATKAARASEMALKTRQAAITGKDQMSQMVTAMSEIDQASQNINKIIRVIDEIAFQTNLLALNAAVEAARAGVHGKGFAVVADEVRNLAARSAGAAKETAEIIDRSLRKVELGTQMAHRTSGHLDDIVVSVNEAATLVSDIAAASSEQSTAIDQVEGALNQVTSVTQQNTTNAGDCASASEELAAQVDTLRNLLAEFRLGRERAHEGRGNHEGRGAHEGRSRPILGGPAPRRSAAGNEGRGGRYVPPPIDEADFGRY